MASFYAKSVAQLSAQVIHNCRLDRIACFLCFEWEDKKGKQQHQYEMVTPYDISRKWVPDHVADMLKLVNHFQVAEIPTQREEKISKDIRKYDEIEYLVNQIERLCKEGHIAYFIVFEGEDKADVDGTCSWYVCQTPKEAGFVPDEKSVIDKMLLSMDGKHAVVQRVRQDISADQSFWAEDDVDDEDEDESEEDE